MNDFGNINVFRSENACTEKGTEKDRTLIPSKNVKNYCDARNSYMWFRRSNCYADYCKDNIRKSDGSLEILSDLQEVVLLYKMANLRLSKLPGYSRKNAFYYWLYSRSINKDDEFEDKLKSQFKNLAKQQKFYKGNPYKNSKNFARFIDIIKENETDIIHMFYNLINIIRERETEIKNSLLPVKRVQEIDKEMSETPDDYGVDTDGYVNVGGKSMRRKKRIRRTIKKFKI